MFAPSLRSRIYLLAVLTCILLVGAATAFLVLLRNSESSTLAAAQAHLGTLARTLAEDSMNRSTWEARHATEPAIEAPETPGSNQLLALMTAAVLQHEPGIEGGFYSKGNDDLLGYAFPTHPGPGLKTDIPIHERPAIAGMARDAVRTGQMQTLRFAGARDATVFAAWPIAMDGKNVGAAWMMQRMPGLNAGTNMRLLGGMIAFALGALLCAVIAFLAVTQVEKAVHSVGGYLGGLGTDLSSPRPARLKLAEFESLLCEVDALASTLRSKNENERRLEAKLRHQERLSSLGQFAAGIAHEIRNPLATIRLRIQMSQRATADSVLHRNGEIALEEIARLDAMIERLLYFSRPIRLERDVVELSTFCRQAAESHRGAAAERGIRIEVVAPDPVFVSIDRDQMRQVLDNIIGNAMEAVETRSEDQRWIECSVHARSPWAEVQVEDSGAGFPAGVAANALDPFFTTKQKGTGLGLSIAYEILQTHEGQLVVANSARGGASVTLRLRCADGPATLQTAVGREGRDA
jgi:signal transduction histidine kinase